MSLVCQFRFSNVFVKHLKVGLEIPHKTAICFDVSFNIVNMDENYKVMEFVLYRQREKSLQIRLTPKLFSFKNTPKLPSGFTFQTFFKSSNIRNVESGASERGYNNTAQVVAPILCELCVKKEKCRFEFLRPFLLLRSQRPSPPL